MNKRRKTILSVVVFVLCCSIFAIIFVNKDFLFKKGNITSSKASITMNSKDVVGVEGPKGKYNEGIILVKSESFDESDLDCISYKNVNQLYANSKWYKVELNDNVDTEKTVTDLIGSNKFEKVDYDYVMESDGYEDVSTNPNVSSETYLNSLGIYDAWDYMESKGATKGGSQDVVIAVIDTGVDYNHIDLRNNIWINSAEIPDNGIDDDNNGFIDDYYGWNCVGDNNNPMDDNGHGTHVAGIIAAENNDVGTVGIAYNCKIMAIKAGNSSGYFTNSDIAEAIQYAYMNGASVINMSFGGSSLSSVVEDALIEAYNSCILVAAAGNDHLCNNVGCFACYPYVGASYPAALPYVIGVMSANSSGTNISAFSNYDHYPFNSIEYEVLAPGEQILSTWPNNKTNTLSGTSMACPVVSAVAALLRSTYTDRDTYSTKYILSQIVNNGTALYSNHNFINAYDSLTKYPKPAVSLYDYYIFDNTEFSSKNNGNGIIDAGETIHLAIELKNRGGVASNVAVTIDTTRNQDSSIVDPYFTIVTSSINLSDIGTYSVRDCDKIYENQKCTGTTKYFEIKVSDDCPNDYLATFNVNYSYTNGLDTEDTTNYSGNGNATLSVSKGYILPETITEDTIFTNDKRYILALSCVIPEGVTVTFEEGCEIQFFANDSSYYSSGIYNSPEFQVYGTLNLNGTSNNNVYVHPSELYSNYSCRFSGYNNGTINFEYVKGENIVGNEIGASSVCVNNSYLYDLYSSSLYRYIKGNREGDSDLSITTISNSKIIIQRYNSYIYTDNLKKSYFYFKRKGYFQVNNSMDDCVVLSDSLSSYSSYICGDYLVARNNAFISTDGNDISTCFSINNVSNFFDNNYFSEAYRVYANKLINGYLDSNNDPVIDINAECSDYEALYPFIKSITLLDKDGIETTKVGKEEFTLRIVFTRSMDTSYNPTVYFGSVAPYSDYQVEGSYISSTIWEGKYTLSAFIENGIQHFKVKGAYAKDSDTGVLKELVDNSCNFYFDIDTSSAMSMNLYAYSSADGINLEWVQDDYDTLMGYNVYRSTEKDGNYVKLNTSVLSIDENTFVDENAEPGVTYWYTFTVVFSDLSESSPAGKISCEMMDTIKPSIYHTPVNQGYTNNNLVITCTASDNIGVTTVTLYYRVIGNDTYKTINMTKLNSKFSATIYSSDLSLDGIEYYIVATDGINLTNKGEASDPYKITIKDSSTIAIKGDVDGDGQITTKDALMIIKAINGDLILTDDEFKKADLNNDNVLSSVEALRILQYINGNVITLEM